MAKTKRRKESSWKKDKVILMADIKIFRLSSGEDVITEKGDMGDGGNTTVIPTKNVITKYKIGDL